MIAEVTKSSECETGSGATFETGVVLSVSGEEILVEAGGELHQMGRASGCLLDPRKGDTVLFVNADGRRVVVTILATIRTQTPRSMTFPGGMFFRSEGEIRVEASRFHGVFSEFSVSAPLLTLTGDLLTFAGRKISEVAQTVERLADWLHDRARSATREVESVDRQQAGSVMIEAESLVSVTSRSAILSASDLMKIDSNQTHLG